MSRYITQLEHHPAEALPANRFAEFLPPLSPGQADKKEELDAYMKAAAGNLERAILRPYRAPDTHRLRSRMTDRLILALFGKHVEPLILETPISLVAVGGYGREEMSLYSDVDLLFLMARPPGGELEEGIQRMLYPLWDLKLDVGHAVRTIAECREQARSDHTVFTNLLESRMLAGDSGLYSAFRELVISELALAGPDFLATKIRERDERHAKFGGSVYLLEPNLKEGKGGLRDIHMLRWLARSRGGNPSWETLAREGLATSEEIAALDFSLGFLLQVRNRLHLLKGRRQDQVQFDAQDPLARAMGFADSPTGILAVELFMQCYYTVAWQVRQINKTVVLRLASASAPSPARKTSRELDENFRVADGQIAVDSATELDRDPSLLMTLFRHVQKTGLEIHFDTKEAVERRLHLVNDAFRADPCVAAAFRGMMGDPEGLGNMLRAMHEVRFFEAYIPEFRKLRHRVQHDIYHVYTVDTHSIFAVGELSRLCEGIRGFETAPYAAALKEIVRPDLLAMALLFHDVGKGEGGNHSAVGADMAKRAAARLGFSREDRETIAFLVLAHLMMPHLSQRRDLEEPHLIREFARAVETPDRLHMLYVLSWADIRAVSAEAWTEWKGTLLTRLYTKTLAVLSGPELSPEYAGRRATHLRRAILERLRGEGETGEPTLERFLHTVPPRYLVAHDDEEIARDFRFAGSRTGEGLLFHERGIGPEVSELRLLASNNPRVLSLVTGVLLAGGVNILDMEVFPLTDGDILMKIRAQTEARESLDKGGLASRLEGNLRDVFAGKTRVDELIAKRRRPAYLETRRPVRKEVVRIDVDNDVSPYYTVIDVYAHDRLGLLYDIIRCLSFHGCYLEVSKISTKVEQVVDTFYVKDIFGHKITSKAKLDEIRRGLIEAIEPPDPADAGTGQVASPSEEKK